MVKADLKKIDEQEVDDLYKKLSNERKELQEKGELPEFFTTAGWQLFKAKYLSPGESAFERYDSIAKTAAKQASRMYGRSYKHWKEKFFDLLWEGILSPATPVLSNMGTNKGCTVSCSGNYVGDSIYDFYESRKELAMLTKVGFGTSSYLGNIRGRGAPISVGGNASGSLPELKGCVQVMRDVSQGNSRRGAWAGYLEIDHPDYYEWVTYLFNYPDDCNIGWLITDDFVNRLESGDNDAIARWKKMLYVKMITGKGYIVMIDKINRNRPECYKKNNLTVKASNLCTEITLFSDKDHTYTCVLSSLNLKHWKRINISEDIFNATVFLDCVCQEFIDMGKEITGLEKAVRFTEKGRALGLGVMGLHTYFQDNDMPFESFAAYMANNQIFKKIHDESLRASKWMASIAGEPEWCKGFGIRNTHRTAIAPTTSTALILGGVSQGIEPIPGNCYNQPSAGGEVRRINPKLIGIMKEREVYNKQTLNDIRDNKGSVQHVTWLTDEEKEIFKTAFEMNMRQILKMAEARQKWIDQTQSLNLFFDADETEQYISEIHKEAILSDSVLTLYYIRTLAGIQASKGEDCVVCE
tara:strand:+ start:2179 stop:3924 length:1746 start_codon:yes stop_codon:yes gene_type:complete